jgi:hypothetical protein
MRLLGNKFLDIQLEMKIVSVFVSQDFGDKNRICLKIQDNVGGSAWIIYYKVISDPDLNAAAAKIGIGPTAADNGIGKSLFTDFYEYYLSAC